VIIEGGWMSDPSEPLDDAPRPDSEYVDAILIGFAYWLDHLDELIDGLRQAPLKSADDPPAQWPHPFAIVINDPPWWVNHPHELQKRLREVVDSLGAE
jgi:hypothetical protein